MRVLMLALLAGLVGCASGPRSPDPETASIPAPPGETQESAKAKREAAVAKSREFKPPPGYKAKILDWDVVYCQKTQVLGSRYPREVCMTEAQLKEHIAVTEALRGEMSQRSAICSSPETCNPQ